MVLAEWVSFRIADYSLGIRRTTLAIARLTVVLLPGIGWTPRVAAGKAVLKL